jgi:TonB family protein
MKYLNSIFKPAFSILLLCCAVAAQTNGSGTNSFDKEGLAFNYPNGWTITDKSTAQAQHLILTTGKSSILIMVVAYRELIADGAQFKMAQRGITEPYIESITKNLTAAGAPAKQDNPCIDVAGSKVAGQRIRGQYQNAQSTAEVYSLVKGHRFINLIYIRNDKDAPLGDTAWAELRQSLKVVDIGANNPSVTMPDTFVSGGVLNGKALSLPRPEYGVVAKAARQTGTVTVQVTIDEQGRVIAAKAVAGPPLLHEVSVEAARRAKFSPTLLCNQPVKVTGVITYTFVFGSRF